MVAEESYAGLDLSELLRLEVELCTPLKRKDWTTDKRFGTRPQQVRVALLRDVRDNTCEPKGLDMNDLSPVLGRDGDRKGRGRDWRETRIFQLFKKNPPFANEDDQGTWEDSRKILRAMLGGMKKDGVVVRDEKTDVVNRIVSYFFTDERQLTRTPPFFRPERTDPRYAAWPHDDGEGIFFAVSLAQRHVQPNTRARWFMATGGDVLRSLVGPAFKLRTDALTAALCLGLDFTFVIPKPVKFREAIHEYLDRVQQYWLCDLDIERFFMRFPDLARLETNKRIGEQVLEHFHIREISMDEGPRSVDEAAVSRMFPLEQSVRRQADTGDLGDVYAPTFLNPWLRFHWADVLVESEQRCEPQYAAIAFNDISLKNTLHLLPPESMFEYLKWLTAFAAPRPVAHSNPLSA